MSANENLTGVNLADLRSRLNANEALMSNYPRLRMDVSLSDTELSELLSAVITRVNLNPTLKDVDLSADDLEDINVSGANLRGMDFSGKTMNLVRFSYCDLVGAKFNQTSTDEVDFGFSKLNDAEFIDAELSDSNFDSADLTDANLSGAKMDTSFFNNTNLQDIIYDDLTEFPDLTESVNVPTDLENLEYNERPILHDPFQEPEGVAFEIHNVFNKIDIDKYHELITKSSADLRRGGPRGNWDLAVIKFALETIVDVDFPKNEAEQARAKSKIKAIITRLKNSDVLRSDKVMKLVSDTMQFVSIQPPAFKVFYVTAFIQDCYHAYSDPATGLPFETDQGMSCLQGIVERFVWIIGDTVQAMIANKSKKAVYKDLLNVFGKNKLDLNELTQQWDEEVLQKPDFSDKEKKTKEQVKKSFMDFMKAKYSAAGMWVPNTQEQVRKRAEELDYVFEGRVFGGRSRRTSARKLTKRRRTKKRVLRKKNTKNTKKRR